MPLRSASSRDRAQALGAVTNVLFLLGALALASPAPAGAHAGPLAATPPPGLGLVQAPGAVVLRFSEPLSFRLSRIEVLDQASQEVTVGPTVPVEGDPHAMQRKLGLLTPGQYTVRWTTVSTLDGHTLRGSYTFGIGRGSLGNQRIENDPLASEGWLGLLGRLAALVGLVLWAGFALIGRVALRAGTPEARLLALGRAGPLLALAGTTLAVVSSAIAISGSPAAVSDLLFASRSGRLRVALIAASGAGVVVGPRRRITNLVLAVVALVAEAGSGHSASAALPMLAGVSFAVHLAAAGVWVFAIAAAALSSDRLIGALSTFSPYAICAAAVVGSSGLANAALELTEPADLWSTAYGKTLLGKAVAFVTMASLGLVHHRRRRRPDAARTAVELPLRLELGAAALALALATVLVGFPNPPRELAPGQPLLRIDPVLASLQGREALSVAGASGPFIVGLTMLPPWPGPVEVRLQILGLEAGDAPRHARLRGAANGGSFDALLQPCEQGFGCFAGIVRIEAPGLLRLRASLTSNRGPIALETVLVLPAPDGSWELARTIESMERLRTARYRERLRGAVDTPLIITDYRFRAPDAFEMKFNEGLRRVIGERSFSRGGTLGPWSNRPWPGLPFTWPRGYYREFWRDAVAIRLLGVEDVDGVPTNVLGFVRPELPAWFRVWVGRADGLIRRQEMLAEGHIMEHVYDGFDEPIDLEPPV